MSDEAASARQQIDVLQAQSAPLLRIQQAERELARLPRTEADARARYARERDEALARARPLAGIAPQAQPFPVGDPEGDPPARERYDNGRVNFIALMLCLMMGTAAMPHVLTRYYTTTTVSEARRSVAWSLLFIVLLYMAAPVLAVLIKHEVFNHLVGLPFDELPQWVRRWSRLDGGLVSVRDVNGDGIVQFGEIQLAGDVIVLAAPEIGGLPYFVTCLVATGGLAAALSTADGLLLTIANAVSHDIYYRVVNPRAPAMRRVMVSKLLVMLAALLAATIASVKNTDILQFVSAAFSLAGATFFPTLVLGIFWRRASHAGAVAGMLVGLIVCCYYMATNLPVLRSLLGIARPLAECQWFGVDPVAAGVFGVPAGLVALVVCSLLFPSRDTALGDLVEELRFPGPDER